MKTVVNRIDLGITRIAGYNLFCSETREFQETTPREVKALVNQGQVNGLKLLNGEVIELDTDGFNMRNLKIKSAVGKFRTLYPADNMMNMFAVVRVIETDDGCRLYEIISNKCARVKITHERLNRMIEMGYYVAGVRMVEGKIKVCDGVTIQNKRSKGEQMANQCYAEEPEVKQHLKGANIEMDSVLLEVDNSDLKAEHGENATNAEDKQAELVTNKSNTSVEKVNSLEAVFDSLDVTKYSTGFDVNTGEDSENGHSTEQADEKKRLAEKPSRNKNLLLCN